ncbi:MAG: hypothetical protein RLZZ450_74 [Pseudomonadota bacterium]|jgi:hypothetical protein
MRKVLSQAGGSQSEVLVEENYQSVLAANVFSTSTAFATTGLTLPGAALAKYSFLAYVPFSSAAVGTGLKLQLSLPSFVTMAARFEIPITASTAVVAYVGAAPANATGTAVAVAGTKYLAKVEGIIDVSVAGTFDLQFASEVAASQVTVYAGACLTLTRLA